MAKGQISEDNTTMSFVIPKNLKEELDNLEEEEDDEDSYDDTDDDDYDDGANEELKDLVIIDEDELELEQ